MSMNEIMAKLQKGEQISTDEYAILQTQVKGKTGSGFQHVKHPPVYRKEMKEGKQMNIATEQLNPNNLKISFNFKIGKRDAGFSINKQKVGNHTMGSALAVPLTRIWFDDGKLAVRFDDTYSTEERKEIESFIKQKYVEVKADQVAEQKDESATPEEEEKVIDEPKAKAKVEIKSRAMTEVARKAKASGLTIKEVQALSDDDYEVIPLE